MHLFSYKFNDPVHEVQLKLVILEPLKKIKSFMIK
jgi:hypothetical protein